MSHLIKLPSGAFIDVDKISLADPTLHIDKSMSIIVDGISHGFEAKDTESLTAALGQRVEWDRLHFEQATFRRLQILEDAQIRIGGK